MITLHYNLITSECTLETFSNRSEAEKAKKEYEAKGIDCEIREMMCDISTENAMNK